MSARPDDDPPYPTMLERILDAARWAPSSDNVQFWRFEPMGDDRLVLHIVPSVFIMKIREDEAVWLSVGMLLEAMNIAASQEGKSMQWERLAGEKSENDRFEITFSPMAGLKQDPLYPYLRLRHTNRQHYRTTPLTPQQKEALETALGERLNIAWRCSFKERWQTAKINMQAFIIRMSSRTAYEQLAEQLDWQNPFSRTKIPVHTLSATPLSRLIMRWMMKDWGRIGTAAKIPGALLPSAIELELLPALYCGGHFIVTRAEKLPQEETREAFIEEGRVLMRFWLTLTRLGLTMQPSYSPIVFSHYGNFPERLPADERFLASRGLWLAAKLTKLSGMDTENIVFMGRIGLPKSTAVASRSLRKSLNTLLVP
jgi:hypothetical protein